MKYQLKTVGLAVVSLFVLFISMGYFIIWVFL